MEEATFKTSIAAPRSKVWEVLWGDKSYGQWTSVFCEGSRVETNWKEGSRALFLDGKGHGMVSMINSKRENEFMSFKHLGNLINGVEDLDSPEVKDWAGALENYTLTDEAGGTELVVEIDVNDQFKDYFNETMPKALEKIKALAEQDVN